MPEASSSKPRRANGSRNPLWGVALYALLLLAAGAAFLFIRWGATAGGSGRAGSHLTIADDKTQVLPHVLLALVAVIIAGRLLGALFAYLHQPAVIGEVIAGILLGPSLLGRVAPGLFAFLLPGPVAPFLSLIAQLGVVLYMFLVGLELDPGMLRRRLRSTVAISHASIIVPFLLGACLAVLLYPKTSTPEVGFTRFALFLGISMSVTAFPVLARILTDRSISKTRLGTLALTCAAVDDVTAWCLLALVVGVARANFGQALLTVVLTLAYVAFMFLLARPAMARLAERVTRNGKASPNGIAAVFVALLVSSLLSEFIGIHAIFGAFLLGAIIPHDSKLARDLAKNLEDFVTVLLLPAFFAYTGMRTQLALVSGVEAWLFCGLILVVATAGKFGGTYCAARLSGHSGHESAALGILMNTRGLMELIVLNIGLDLGIISPVVFAMLMIMAVVTTMATTPVLDLLMRRGGTGEAYLPKVHSAA